MAFTNSNIWTRLTNWEYWPLPIVYIPIYLYWFILSVRARSFFFFTASNPGIEYGGMLGESKIKIMDTLPSELIPVTEFIDANTSSDEIQSIMAKLGLAFPVVIKPDIGERGWQVSIIYSKAALDRYSETNKVNLLLQEYIDLPVELGVFYYRFPGTKMGTVTSIVEKGMLMVEGDGTLSVHQLLRKNPRGKLQIDRLLKTNPELMEVVPAMGEIITVVPIGNHRLGTAFLDGNKYINEKIIRQFNDISAKIDGFYFGRFDLRCKSIQELEAGKMKIMELNGAGAEPAHIYHPGASIWKAYRVLLHHWKVMFQISLINHKRGIPYLSLKDGIEAIRKLKKYNQHKIPYS